MINSSDISVIIQGIVDPLLTLECTESVRKHLPDSEIILSTWENSKISDAIKSKVDKIVLSKDPGGRVYSSCGSINNVARQILSTKNGLKEAKRDYAFKIRSDIMLFGTKFISSFKRFKGHKKSFKIFDEKIIICNLFSSSHYITPMLFHPSDWVSFGYTHDLIKLWDIPSPTDDINFNFFDDIKNPNHGPHPTVLGKFVPEQYIMTECIKKHLPNCRTIKHYYDSNNELISHHVNVMSSNFVILDYRDQFEIEFKKYNPEKHAVLNQMDFVQWAKMYNSCTDNSAKIPIIKIIKHILRYKDRNQIINRKIMSIYVFVHCFIRQPRKTALKAQIIINKIINK
jgi:hypothetical protein